MLPSRSLRIGLFLAIGAALMPLSGLFPFAYPVLLLALTFAFDRRAVTTLGLRAVPLVLVGIAGGVAMCALRIAGLKVIADGTLEVQFSASMVAFMVSSVLAEELLFRGYAFKTFADRNRWMAIAVFAILFGVYHWIQWKVWGNPQAMLLMLISTGAAHVLFALAFLRSGSLWLPIGLHLGWNVSDQALRLAGVPFLTGYVMSLAVLALAITAVVVISPRARPLPAASP